MDQEEYSRLVDDYNSEVDRHNRLVKEKNNLIDAYNTAVRTQQLLKVDVSECHQDVKMSDSHVNQLYRRLTPPMETEGKNLTITGGKEFDCVAILDELSESYGKFKNQSSASKEMTKLVMQYFSKYGDYSKVRNVALGYVVGLDADIWTSDTPRKTVEKAYLANSNYWLSSAMMATMLWVSNEPEAAQRAIKQALEKDAKKTALYFLLVTLRFERTEAAKKWYKIYMGLFDPNNITDEFQYILQALLNGCFGRDSDFEKECMDQIEGLINNSFKRNPKLGEELTRYVANKYAAVPNQTREQYTMMGRSISDYKVMLDVLSEAEKNSIILDRYKYVHENKKHNKTLALAIEDTLSNLLSAYDEEEKAHLDLVRKSEMVMKANGDLEVAERLYAEEKQLEKQRTNIIYFLIDVAISTDDTISLLVKKFALKIVGKYCRAGAKMFADSYRRKYKDEYQYSFDGWTNTSDENAYDSASQKLTEHYKREIKKQIKGDKTIKNCTLFTVISFLIALGLTALAIFLKNTTAIQRVFIIIAALVAYAVAIIFIYMANYQKHKIIDANQIVIDNGLRYLKLVLDDIKKWKLDYKTQDDKNKEIISLLE